MGWGSVLGVWRALHLGEVVQHDGQNEAAVDIAVGEDHNHGEGDLAEDERLGHHQQRDAQNGCGRRICQGHAKNPPYSAIQTVNFPGP